MKRYTVSAMCVLNIVFVAGLSVLLTGCGCGRKGEESVPDQVQVDPARAAFEALRAELVALQENGDRDAVVARLRSALNDEELVRFDSTIFAWLLGELVASEEGLVEARALYLQAVEDNEPRMREAFGLVANAYLRMENRVAALAWCRELLGKDLPQEVSTRIWLRVAQMNIEDENFDACVDDVPTVIGTLSPINAERILWAIVNAELKASRFEDAKKLLEVVQEMELTDERLICFQTLAKVDMLLAARKPLVARDLLLSQWKEIPDGDLSRRLMKLLETFSAGGQEKELDTLGVFALESLGEKPRSQKHLVVGWIQAASDSGDRAAFVRRMTTADASGQPVAVLLRALEGGFYATVSGGSESERDACIALAEKMQKRVPEKDELTANRLAMLRLDGAFFKQDFKSALAIIDEGVDGQDEEWHKVLRNKVTAHLALVEGRTDDAIAGFREHMKTVEGWDQPQMNPQSGIQMSKESVLGFNEKRIGDIYMGAGRAAEAKVAYKRARAYYQQAIAAAEADSKEAAVYKEERALVPAVE
ncbi:MAG: hypothetical protein ISS35_04895 [Kiritimatiellae bacterium]|nr:hypothetical protein [Kiritimatiellia bacterium]